MNPTVQRYLPPLIVIGAAIFFGWPPAAPLDLGEDVIRANSVRWRVGDLEDPPAFEILVDPFREVLVNEPKPEQVAGVIEVEPTGPEPAAIKAGLSLDGMAQMGGRTWAVLNGRPRLPGDFLRTDDANQILCEIVSVHDDHVVVRSEGTVVEVFVQPFGARRIASRSRANALPSAPSSANPTDENSATPGEVPPPPSN